jgi:hypothetical protein
MRIRGSEEYIYEIIESKEFWSTIMIPNYMGIKRKLGIIVKMVFKKNNNLCWSLCQIEIKK